MQATKMDGEVPQYLHRRRAKPINPVSFFLLFLLKLGALIQACFYMSEKNLTVQAWVFALLEALLAAAALIFEYWKLPFIYEHFAFLFHKTYLPFVFILLSGSIIVEEPKFVLENMMLVFSRLLGIYVFVLSIVCFLVGWCL